MSEILRYVPTPQRPGEPSPLTVAEVIALFLRNESKNYAADSLTYRKHYWSLFSADLGHKRVADCIPFDLEDWLNAHPSWGANTLKTICATIHRPMNWAARLRLIPANPFAGVTRAEGDPRRSMTRGECVRLLRGTSALFRRVLLFLWYTGARPGEMAKLEWRHIRWGEDPVIVFGRQDGHKTWKKTRKPRVIPLIEKACRLLLWLHVKRPWDAFVFTNARGGRWKKESLDLRLQRLRKKTGIPDDCKLYGTRHAWASNGVLAGGSPKLLATGMGTSLATFEKSYCHVDRELGALRAEAEKAARSQLKK